MYTKVLMNEPFYLFPPISLLSQTQLFNNLENHPELSVSFGALLNHHNNWIVHSSPFTILLKVQRTYSYIITNPWLRWYTCEFVVKYDCCMQKRFRTPLSNLYFTTLYHSRTDQHDILFQPVIHQIWFIQDVHTLLFMNSFNIFCNAYATLLFCFDLKIHLL